MHMRHRQAERNPCWRETNGIADIGARAPCLHPAGSSLPQKSKYQRMRLRAKTKIRLIMRRDADAQVNPAARSAVRSVRWGDQDLSTRQPPTRRPKAHSTETASAPRKRYSAGAPAPQGQPCTRQSAAAEIASRAN